ncbi:hypothetical protein OXPF_11330 [Oxobacter pfennigii]|uniref:DUF1294 domain-containing protein n=1 Tax=Oxobacter pfennigii TaxID=36849 RepID=A0A0P8W9B6_9CLOT|nr:DUF1294 domain-containing protein [Oxobacter pfennigii]KPU45241.1 hypothetical protein OXPF_11330 [Oxobacter pfennigii]
MDKFLKNAYIYVLAYILVINAYAFFIMGIDKWKSARKKWRVPEKSIFITAIIGGALGIYSGMRLFHHKTLHNKFKYGIPAIVILNIVAFAYVIYRII